MDRNFHTGGRNNTGGLGMFSKLGFPPFPSELPLLYLGEQGDTDSLLLCSTGTTRSLFGPPLVRRMHLSYSSS